MRIYTHLHIEDISLKMRNEKVMKEMLKEKIAEIKNLPPETVAEISEKNAKSLFFK